MKLKEKKMPSVFRRKAKNENEEKPLMKNIEQTEGEQASEHNPQQSGVNLDVEAHNKRVLHTLRKILSDQSTPEDFDTEVEMLKTLSKLNNYYSQYWLCEYLHEIDQFVKRHFPTLPTEGPRGSQKIQDFLKSAQSLIHDEVLRLTPALRDAGLLDHLKDSYSHHLFTNLDLLLNRDLSVKELFCLLLWGKDVFLSPDSQYFFRVHDPLLLTGWFERATEKLLPKLQDDISRTLQNILDHDEQHRHNGDSMDGEAFIRVYLDVIQCLNAVIQSCKEFSHTLMCKAQTLCLKELQHFVQEYVYVEKKLLEKQKDLKNNSVQLFRLISTCRQLRFFALENLDTNNRDILSNTIQMLKELESHILSVVQKMVKRIAQDFLRCYFKEGVVKIQVLTEAIQKHCVSLPQNDAGKEIQEIFVNVSYDCVSRVYLDCLIKSKYRRLEKRWGNVGDRMREDSLNLYNALAELDGRVDQRNHLLQRLSDVLLESDVNALKITCYALFSDFPQESEQYVAGLLRWKRMLSKRQIKEVLDASWPNSLEMMPRRITYQPLKGLCCCL